MIIDVKQEKGLEQVFIDDIKQEDGELNIWYKIKDGNVIDNHAFINDANTIKKAKKIFILLLVMDFILLGLFVYGIFFNMKLNPYVAILLVFNLTCNRVFIKNPFK